MRKTTDLRKWWDHVTEHDPKIRYFPNATNSVLIVTSTVVEQAWEVFQDSNVKVTMTIHMGRGESPDFR